MKTTTLLFVAFALFFANIVSANSDSANFGFKESKDDFKISDTDIIYAQQKLRNILNFYSKLDFSKQEDRLLINNISTSGIKNIEEYLKLVKEKFIITGITKYKHKNHFCENGAYDFCIVINKKNIESISITITEDGKICHIMDHDIKYKRDRDTYLFKQKYKDYWL